MDVRLRKLQRKAITGGKKAKRKFERALARIEHASFDLCELEASVCRDSLYQFVRRFWSSVVQEDPVWNWHIEVLCDYLQEAAERVFRGEPLLHDIVINIPPGTTKSTIASVMFPAWCWTRLPSCKIISSSHAHSLATTLSRKSRMVVTSDKWKRLFPEVVLSEDQNAKHHFTTVQGGMRLAVGTEGAIVGHHAHIIVIDDPIDPMSALSETVLASANRFISETLATRKTSKANSLTILIMQRLHQNDPSAMLLKEAEEGGTPVKHICLPGEIEHKSEVKPRKLAKYYINKLLDPVRMGQKVLWKLKKRLGQYGYAGQILQKPVPPGGGMFQTQRIQIDTPPPLLHFRQLVRYWDKAGTKDGGAYTVGLLMGEDAKKRFWLLDVVRGQWDSGSREAVILQTTKMDGHKVLQAVEQEPGSGGKESAQATIRNLAGYRCVADRPTGDKTTRADVFSVQVNGDNVYMLLGIWNKELLEEMKFFPASTYKDQVDALSGAFKMLTLPRRKVGGIIL